ncbi:MAG: tripartite tricarboxylate transporter receptor family protein, partial [candidate division NC10 bacterium]|nr:tripartite tricarboxylate transporter receptor family protein [candidate division NC10 bacterium]
MKRRDLVVLLVCVLAMPLIAQAQDFPTRPINVVAPFPPGGQADLMARPTAAAMEKILKSPVVVVNKT